MHERVLTVGFEQIILQQGAVGLHAGDVLDTYVYRNGVLNGQWGIAAAVGLVYQVGAGAALQDSEIAESGLHAAERAGVVVSVAVVAVGVLVASVVLSVLRSSMELAYSSMRLRISRRSETS